MGERAITEIGARDRLVMTGLVLLGLLTVIAGVLSGRSTIDYVLGRDAREAALSWAGQIDKKSRRARTAGAATSRSERRRAQCPSIRQPSRARDAPLKLDRQ